MRLSLAIAVALLFASVFANPSPMDPWDQPPPPDDRKGKGKQREKSNTPPELGGSQGSKSSDSTDAGFGLTSAGRGWGSVPTRHFDDRYPGGDTGTLSKSQIKKQNLNMGHPSLILGSTRNSGGGQVAFAPMSHDFKDNKSVRPARAQDFNIHGNKVDEGSQIHSGRPKITDAGNVRMFAPEQEDYKVDKHGRNKLLRTMRDNENMMAGLSLGGDSRGRQGGGSPPRRAPSLAPPRRAPSLAPSSSRRESAQPERGGRDPITGLRRSQSPIRDTVRPSYRRRTPPDQAFGGGRSPSPPRQSYGSRRSPSAPPRQYGGRRPSPPPIRQSYGGGRSPSPPRQSYRPPPVSRQSYGGRRSPSPPPQRQSYVPPRQSFGGPQYGGRRTPPPAPSQYSGGTRRPPSYAGPRRSDSPPPLRDDRPPLRDDRPSYRDDRPPLRDDRPSYRDDRPPYRDDRPPLRGARPPLRDDRPPYRDDRSPSPPPRRYYY